MSVSPQSVPPGEPLVVRQHERFACRLPASVTVSADSPVRLTLSRAAGNGTGVVSAVVVDCSAGGIGVETDVFFPRGAELLARVEAGDAEPGAWLEVSGLVQRAAMVSRAPRYYLGLAFKGARAPAQAEVARRLDRARLCSAGTGEVRRVGA
jgi:hypothetical protein